MKVGDLVTRKSYDNDIAFCIIGFTAGEDGEIIAILKALYNHSFLVDAPLSDLENILAQGKL
ncbi:hypothetical protein GGQ84_000444 [Desulfitispora alkaliphila]|uniref:sporulation peptidase YabG n=1 Tax=Desulfitispora alkaliphila TaxID=622674 RepID=UPI003D1B37C3